MSHTADWIALAVLVFVLYLADLKHIAASHYNTFLILLLGLVSGLVSFLKLRHRVRAGAGDRRAKDSGPGGGRADPDRS